MQTRDATIAARVPHDLRDDLQAVCDQAGDANLTVTLRRLLRSGCDRELNQEEPPANLFGARASAGQHHRFDPSTSKSAARDNQPRAGSQRARLLLHLLDHPAGLTYDEANARDERRGIPVAGVGFARRATELADAGAIGFVTRDGERLTRKTRHGSEATVYKLTTKGEVWAKALREAVAAKRAAA